jgi:hypothetical protein
MFHRIYPFYKNIFFNHNIFIYSEKVSWAMDETEWLYARRIRSARALHGETGRSVPRAIEQYLALEYPRENARWVLQRWTKRGVSATLRRK